MSHPFVTRILLGFLISASVSAQDWPQWRGVNRDGVTSEKISVSSTRPKELWRSDIGLGHAAVSIFEKRLIAIGSKNQQDTIRCLATDSGKELWNYSYPAAARMKGEPGNGAWDGPHATPLIDHDRVFTLSRDGQVICLNLSTGKEIWKRHVQADVKAQIPECGFAGSPLLLDGLLIVSVGSAGHALDAQTGASKWSSGSDLSGYSAPVPCSATVGTKHLLMFGGKSLDLIGQDDGKSVWSVPWPTEWGANVVDPMVLGDAVFITSAYDRGCALLDLKTGTARWQNRVLGSQCSPAVLRNQFLYGFDGYINDAPKRQALVCMDPLTGKEQWRKPKMAGQMILANDALVLLLTTGELVIARANPKVYEELVRIPLLKPDPCPIPPVLVDGRLFCRTGKGQLFCFDVAP